MLFGEGFVGKYSKNWNWDNVICTWWERIFVEYNYN